MSTADDSTPALAPAADPAVSPASGGRGYARRSKAAGAQRRLEHAHAGDVRAGTRRLLRLVDWTGPAPVYSRYRAGLAGCPRNQGARAGEHESEALECAEA